MKTNSNRIYRAADFALALPNLATFCHTSNRTILSPSTIDVMVDSPSKKQKPTRYKLPSSGNLFLVRVVIYNKIERI